MSFDIFAHDKDNQILSIGGKELYFSASMGVFDRLIEQSYDWFELMGAKDCLSESSGTGESKQIKLNNIENALKVLNSHKSTVIPLDFLNKPRDELTLSKPGLKEFMENCIEWCKENNADELTISFG